MVIGVAEAGHARRKIGLDGVLVDQCALGGISLRDVVRSRQVPGLRVAVTLLADMGAVHVSDNGVWSHVG